MEGLERIAWRPEEKRCYDLAQLQRLLEATRQPYRAMFAIGAMAGLIPSEWLALTWADVDFGGAVLNVSHGMTMNRQHRYERGATKTAYRVRKLPMPPPLLAELQSYEKWYESERGRRPRPEDLLFSTRSGRAMSKDNVRRDGWRKAVQGANLPPAKMNSLRHSYQTIIASMVPEATFERLAGHARGSNVGRRFYVHQTSLGARDLVNAAFSSGCVKKCVKITGDEDA